MSIDQHFAISPVLESSAQAAAELRSGVLERASHERPTTGARPRARIAGRRLVPVGLAAAAVATALVVVPTLLPSDETGRPSLLAGVAAAAERSGRSVIEPGQALHRVERIHQVGGDGAVQIERRTDTWTRPDGTTYVQQTDLRPDVAPKDRVFTSSSGPEGGRLSPSQVAALPTDPQDLLDRFGGGAAATEALLVVLFDGYAPADVWAAIIEAFGSLPGIQVTHDEARGETTVSHWMASKRGDETLTFRDDDGALVRLKASSAQDGGADQTSRFSVEVVDGVPAAVQEAAAQDRELR